MLARNELSLLAFKAFVDSQCPEKRYNFLDCDGGCAIGMYLTSIGRPIKSEHSVEYSTLHHEKVSEYHNLGMLACHSPHTFGALRDRIHLAERGVQIS